MTEKRRHANENAKSNSSHDLKEKNTNEYENYRPISLLNSMYKLSAAVMPTKISASLDQHLQEHILWMPSQKRHNRHHISSQANDALGTATINGDAVDTTLTSGSFDDNAVNLIEIIVTSVTAGASSIIMRIATIA